ncbi:hypothetical protein RUL31_03075 [Bacillus atrophaeus]|uniref:hypothetical protein n=1 Tax=Bacillus atrophaeus TaxID=1452 RepID=UPI0028F6DF94|nr:hypothetical protein [Bacillus atrophaeus]WNV80320.1 hypothetical protein RUL31_03075 [Bacillus atrophaeus]
MKNKMKSFCIALIGLFMVGSLIGCTNQQGSQENTTENHKSTHQNTSNLKKYSKDPDKNNDDEDFDLIGTLDTETSDQLTLVIDQKKVKVPKSSSFKKEKIGNENVKGKLVKVEIDSKRQEAETLELTPQAKADSNGVYEKDDDGDFKLIGKLIKETDTNVTVQVSKGKKTYKKAADYKKDTEGISGDIQGKTVRLEVKENNEVESLDIDPEDQ